MESDTFEVDTRGREVVDITAEVRRFARQAGGDGLLHVFLPHATAGLALMETGAGSESDLEETIARLLPRDDRYTHSHGSPGHGADHVLPALVPPTLTLLVTGGDVELGTWQSVVIVDTNRENNRRRVRLTLLRSG
jgi:secondary thiamine-phosphate synthase enzyme